MTYRYSRKTEFIEAHQYRLDADDVSWGRFMAWGGKDFLPVFGTDKILVYTTDGTIFAYPGDWIVKRQGIEGFRVITDTKFNEKYEKA